MTTAAAPAEQALEPSDDAAPAGPSGETYGDESGAVYRGSGRHEIAKAGASSMPASSMPAATAEPASTWAAPAPASDMGFGGGFGGGGPAAPGEPAPMAGEVAARPALVPDESPAPARRNGQIQSGTLTAGSFDDHQRFDDYRQFVSEAIQHDAHEVLPRIERGHRVTIRVVDAQGRPVGDARVVVRHPAPQTSVLETTTASDGRTFFMAGSDQEQYDVTVTPPDGAPAMNMTMAANQSPWRLTLPQTTARLPRRLDLALVIDTTGSMSDELEYLKVEIDSIAESVHRMFPNVDQRYALVIYRDEGDEYVTRQFDFTGSLGEFRSTLAEQRADGGGDYPEAMHVALERAGQLSWRDRDAARVLFLVGDAPPHDRFARQTIDGVQVLHNRSVRVFPVAASGVRSKAEFVMRAAAFLTLGKYLFLTDHSGVGNPHAKPHVPEYQVERLDRLMIRMIASELAGRHLEADEVIAIEQGDVRITEPEQIEPEPQQPGLTATGTAPALSARDRASPTQGKASVLPWPPAWVLLTTVALLLLGFDGIAERMRS